MNYHYYPGCSLQESAIEYDLSTRAVMAKVNVTLEEIEDWTCCGASAVDSVSKLMAYVLPARNLALARRSSDHDIMVPCSACYLNLLRVTKELPANQELHESVNEVLAEEDLVYPGGARVRHILDILVHDVGPEIIEAQVVFPLEKMTIAPYYGCQILRPYAIFDDSERPTSMEPLLEALGASIFSWSEGGRCCGASLMATKPEVGIESVNRILGAAEGADAIVTVCPLCQMNLEAYQEKTRSYKKGKKQLTILYLPQLMGLAFGLNRKELGMNKNMVITPSFENKIAQANQVTM